MSSMSVDKKFTSPVIQDAKLIEISNAVRIYNRELQCSHSGDLRCVYESSTAASVKHGDPLGKLTLLGILMG